MANLTEAIHRVTRLSVALMSWHREVIPDDFYTLADAVNRWLMEYCHEGLAWPA